MTIRKSYRINREKKLEDLKMRLARTQNTRINRNKKIIFLYTMMNKKLHFLRFSFIVVPKPMKSLDINLKNYVQDLSAKNCNNDK